MSTLGSANSEAEKYSGLASDRVRWLAAAGLAFVWVLAGGQLSGLRRELLVVALLLVVTLLADFAQYLIGWLRWDLFVRRVEREQPGAAEDTQVTVSESLISPIYWAYYVKLVFIVIAYLVLGAVIAFRIFTPVPACFQ